MITVFFVHGWWAQVVSGLMGAIAGAGARPVRGTRWERYYEEEGDCGGG